MLKKLEKLSKTDLRQNKFSRPIMTVESFRDRLLREVDDGAHRAENETPAITYEWIRGETNNAIKNYKKVKCDVNSIRTRREKEIMRCRTYEDFCALFGKEPQAKTFREKHGLRGRIFDKLEQHGRSARAKQHKYRLLCELDKCRKEGWYVIFDTLTTNAWNYKKVWSPRTSNESVFRVYFQKFKRLIERTAEAKGSYKYFAVVERGGKAGRLHLHVLHMCRDIPSSWKVDPNSGRSGRKVVITKMRKLWEYGLSEPQAVRYGGDAFSKLYWAWPLDENGKHVPRQSVTAIANYVCKYILKGNQSRRFQKWRTRMSKNLGLEELKKSMEGLKSSQELESLRSQIYKLSGLRMNRNLLRRNYLSKVYFPRLSIEQVLESLKDLRQTIKLGELLRCSTREIRTHSHWRGGVWRLRKTRDFDKLAADTAKIHQDIMRAIEARIEIPRTLRELKRSYSGFPT